MRYVSRSIDIILTIDIQVIKLNYPKYNTQYIFDRVVLPANCAKDMFLAAWSWDYLPASNHGLRDFNLKDYVMSLCWQSLHLSCIQILTAHEKVEAEHIDVDVYIDTLRQRQELAYGIFKCIFFNWNVLISILVSLNFVVKGPINNILALVHIMACRRPWI